MKEDTTRQREDGARLAEGCSRKELLRRAGGAGLGLALATGPLAMLGCGDDGSATNGSSGAGAPSKPIAIDTAPTVPFDANVAPGPKPDLPRQIGWSLPANGELFTTFDRSIREAAGPVDMEYTSAQANGDSTKQFQQTESLLSRGLGALVVTDVSPPALRPLQLRAIEAGAAVFTGVNAYSTCQFTSDERKLGLAQGGSAVRWIEQSLGGKAEVAMLSWLNAGPQFKPRWEAIREALRAGGPGIELVADVPVAALSPEEGFKVANTVLQKHPDVNVWLAGDSVLAGVLAALKAAGKIRPEVGLFGVDGNAEALKSIEEGGPYKSTQAAPFAVIAHAFCAYAADWLDGKSIPMVLRTGTVELDSKQTIDAFAQLTASPADAFADNATTFRYFTPLGNTSYADNRYLTVVA